MICELFLGDLVRCIKYSTSWINLTFDKIIISAVFSKPDSANFRPKPYRILTRRRSWQFRNCWPFYVVIIYAAIFWYLICLFYQLFSPAAPTYEKKKLHRQHNKMYTKKSQTRARRYERQHIFFQFFWENNMMFEVI